MAGLSRYLERLEQSRSRWAYDGSHVVLVLQYFREQYTEEGEELETFERPGQKSRT